jgi:metal-responsive CopG/Arc/MetJ family transcriptional regulator
MKKENGKCVHRSFKMDARLYNEIDAIAEDEDMSFSAVLRQAARYYCDNYKRNGKNKSIGQAEEL